MARLIIAHRLQHREIGPLACRRLAPFSLSIRRMVSRTSLSSAAVEPTTLRAMIEDDAWPSAHARTSWAKSLTRSPAMARSTVTVEPQSLDSLVEVASGVGKRPIRGMSPASSRMRLL